MNNYDLKTHQVWFDYGNLPMWWRNFCGTIENPHDIVSKLGELGGKIQYGRLVVVIQFTGEEEMSLFLLKYS